MLTPKQAAFCKAFRETGNAETAYRAVYNCSGMSSGHVRQKATRELSTNGTFPKPIKLGIRAIGWLESDIDDWITQRVAQSRLLLTVKAG